MTLFFQCFEVPAGLSRGLRLCLGLFVAWVASLMLAPAAWAQRGDEGSYRILSARYGTAESHVDVTARLKELARRDARFKLENQVFNVDPAPGRRKTLRIHARGEDGQTRVFEYAEYSWVDGRQFIGWRGGNWGDASWNGGWDGQPGGSPGGGRGDDGDYQILSARYGTAHSNVDVTSLLKELARRDARFKLENQIFNVDPAHGQRKTLRIYARGRDGGVRTFEYAEYSWVDGSQFTGWGRGDWGRGGWHGGWDGRPGGNGPGGNGASHGMRLEIISASYGAQGRTVDVTRRLRELARDGWVDAVVNYELLGTDPAPRQRKTLRLTYRTGRGTPQQVDVAEYDRLRLP